ncbi:hypothetical protein ACQ4PT_020950 [Festuca glaucescens]
MDTGRSTPAPDGSDAEDNFKITFRVAEFVAKLGDGLLLHSPKQDVVLQQVSIRGMTLEKLKSIMRESISYGSCQDVHLFCEDKTVGGVDSMIQNASELLVAFMDRWESKQLLLLAEVVDLANIPSSAASHCSDVNANHLPIVDWSTIEIETVEDGNMDAPISQEKMCLALGINESSILHPPAPIVESVVDKELLAEAAIAVDDNMPEELNISYDIDHPTVEIGTMFPSMHDCRMAIRQFAINEEFDLGTKKADRTRWSGECLADGCPWTITARVMADKKTTRNTCPTNGTRKRKRKSKKSSAGGALTIDEAAARAACVELPISESQCTPIKNSMVATLQASPGPVTRRQLSLAMAEDAALEHVVSPPRDVEKIAPKKITPRKKKRN